MEVNSGAIRDAKYSARQGFSETGMALCYVSSVARTGSCGMAWAARGEHHPDGNEKETLLNEQASV